jgi:ribosomal protein L11 methyltransferase
MHQKTRSRPWQNLFIYYIRGRLKAGIETFQDNFLGNWEEDDESFLFFSSAATRQVQNLLNRQPHLCLVDSYQMPYDQWLGEIFSSFEHGPFRVVPPWEAPDCGERALTDKLEVLLDPGLVFGTGTHPTTCDCLDALELAARSKDFKTVLDLGTGTGLLAIAAARLGSQRVVAVDLNLLAARTAAGNVQLNGLQDRVVIVRGKAEEAVAYTADIVVANIHYDVMRHLIDSGGFLAKKRFILSGLLRGEAKEITDRLSRHPLKILKQWTRDGIWYTFYGRRN